MVGFKDDAMAIAQVDNHVLAVSADARLPSHEVLGGCGRAQICQSMLEYLSHRGAQFELCLGLALADGAKRLGLKREFQRVSPSG